jgi:hypothetical protein
MLLGVSATISISPKETEIILEVIDEFVFLNKPTKSRKSNVTQSQMSNLQGTSIKAKKHVFITH